MDRKESFGGEIAKQLPVKEIYDDVAHPALSEVGKALQGAVRIALSPISAMVWSYDKISDYLDVAIPEYFERKKISKEKIHSPDAAIAVPTIEAMRYTSHKPELREMFVNLLGASMNVDTKDEHPAFVEIIKQLSSDECRMLKHLHNVEDKMPMLKYRMTIDGQVGEYDLSTYFSDICYSAECQYPDKFPEYLDNLHRLGLVEVFYDRHLIDESEYEKLKEHPESPKITVEGGVLKRIEKKSLYELSEFGKKFCQICLD